MQEYFLETPLGIAHIKGDSEGIQSISVGESGTASVGNVPEPFQHATKQLREYFDGNRTEFSFKTNPKGTEFQQKVWKALIEIPYGKTISYLELSRRLGDEKAIRAVAAANGKNPLWIVVPCHRVIGSDGSLTGYAGGLHRKKWLLNHECPVKQQSLFPN
ncbi:MAG: methylated-DNA--[protein]-cysteine S-methyltransferase [Flavobacteriaceae bacterium]